MRGRRRVGREVQNASFIVERPGEPDLRIVHSGDDRLAKLREVGLVDGPLPRIHAAQAAGCAPVVRALLQKLDVPEPVKPATIAKSIAIGNPADGFQVLETVRATGGWGAMVPDEAIVKAIQLLAETEGIFTEPAGGTTLASAIDLIGRGVIPWNESMVVCITGNGYKTTEVVQGQVVQPVTIGKSLRDFEAILTGVADSVSAAAAAS